VNVKFDGRNPFARAAQKIVATHPVLKDTTETEAPRVKGNTGKWYALGSIFESLKGLQVRPGGRIRDWSSFPEELIFQRAKDFFDLLEDSRPEYQALREGISPDIMRTKSILLSGTTLRAIAGAIYIRLNEDGLNKPLTSYKTRLSAIDFRPEAPMWQETGFVSAGKSTPNARNQELIAASRAIAEALKG